MNKMIIDNKINNSLFSQSTDKKSAWTSQKGLSTKRSRQRKISISPAFQSLNSKWSSVALMMILSMIHVTMATTAVPKYEDHIFITKTDLDTLVKDSTGTQFQELTLMRRDCQCGQAEEVFTFTLKSPQYGNYYPDDKKHATLAWRYYIAPEFDADVNKTEFQLKRSKDNLLLATAKSVNVHDKDGKFVSGNWNLTSSITPKKAMPAMKHLDASVVSPYKRCISGVDFEEIQQLSKNEFKFTKDMATQLNVPWILENKKHGKALKRITNHTFDSPRIAMRYNAGSITWERSLQSNLWKTSDEFVKIRIEYQAFGAPKFRLFLNNDDDEEITLATSNATLRNHEDKTIGTTPENADFSKKDMASFLLALTPEQWIPAAQIKGQASGVRLLDRRRLLMRLAQM